MGEPETTPGHRAEAPRWARLGAAVTLLVSLPLSIWGLVLGALRPAAVAGAPEFDASQTVFFLSSAAFAVVGAIVLLRRSENRIGWLFCAVGVVSSVSNFATEYATHALIISPGSLPAGTAFAWVTMAPSVLIPISFCALISHFPDGRLPGSRWRWLEAALVLMVILTVVASVAFWPHRGLQMLTANVASVPGADLGNLLIGVAETGAFIVSFGAITTLVVRYRNGPMLTRLQLKWFLYATAVALIGLVTGVSGFFVESRFHRFGLLLTAVGALGVPLAAGVAILRYRLYEIDRIINKTLVYGGVTVALAAIYLAGVLTIQSVLPVTDDSPPVVAVSTLAVVAVFRSVRERVQEIVDRRFYRHRYNASQTLDDFSSRLRHQTDLEALTDDLLGVIGKTVQPAHVSLWLRSVGDRA